MNERVVKTCKSGLHQYDALLNRCPDCHKIARANYLSENREKEKDRKRRWALENKSIDSACKKRWNDANKERRKILDKSRRKILSEAGYYIGRHQDKEKMKKYVSNLAPCYVSRLLNIPVRYLPIEMMEAKISEIKLKRLIKEMKK